MIGPAIYEGSRTVTVRDGEAEVTMIKSAHEPDAPVMSADDVWDDALQVADALRQNLRKNERIVRLQVPFSFFSQRWKILTEKN